MLPLMATVADVRARGVKVNSALWEGSQLNICYRGAQQLLLKPLTEIEYSRAARFLQALDGRLLANVTPFELPPPTAHSGKRFMLMPRYLDVLQRATSLDFTATATLWQNMRAALSAIHELGYALQQLPHGERVVHAGGLG